jgi:hypothetical protein
MNVNYQKGIEWDKLKQIYNVGWKESRGTRGSGEISVVRWFKLVNTRSKREPLKL